MRRGFIIDEDTTDAFMDRPTPRYKGGETLEERLTRKGYDLSPAKMGELASAIEKRSTGKMPALPPPVDH